MNNLSNTMKRFISNKNTVTILGVVLCLVILFVGYNFRINQKVSLTRVPYANQTIQPRTEITAAMISYMEVPESFLVGSYYKSSEDLVGKFSNYNTMIAEGSLFYVDLVVDSSVLPDSAFIDVEEGDIPISYRVDMDSTYANSMMPNDYIDIYFKARDDDDTLMFGKFISNVKVLDVKDSTGQHVFENTTEERVPAYMLFALPDTMHLLFRKAIYLEDDYDVEIILVPSTLELTSEDRVYVSSQTIYDFINERTKMVSVEQIYMDTAGKVDSGTNENQNTNQ